MIGDITFNPPPSQTFSGSMYGINKALSMMSGHLSSKLVDVPWNLTNPYEYTHQTTQPVHYVHPHWVSSYRRKDGTFVHGYWRDGDGDTSINRMTGYWARNPRS